MQISEHPAWPTTLRSRLRDGRLMGTDGSVWLYRAVPMSPVVDARTEDDALAAAEPIQAIYDELASMTSVSVSRRSMAKSNYRETHALLVNVPKFFEPDRLHPLAEYLRQNFSRIPTDRRILLFGVRLKDQVGGQGGWKAAIDSVAETLAGGGTPLSDFDADFERVSGAMDRAGLAPASPSDIALANAWWNHGDFPDTPTLVHGDHLHFFTSAESVRVADSVGVDECHTWSDRGVPGQHAVTFASVKDLDIPFLDVRDPRANWVADLIASGALVVSVRGQVEPSTVTRDELRRQRKRFIDDINERAKSGKMERAEQDEMLHMLSQVEALYSRGGVPPTLAGASIVVGFDGMVGDIHQVLPPGSIIKLSLMNYRQPGGLGETMLCSNLRANPNLQDLPTQVIACSGMPSLNLVGDADGAAVGFTERDRQIALLSPTAASVADTLPILLGAGATGSGKAVPLSGTIPTPSGNTTMGALRVGDEVLGRDGKPCRVTYLSPIVEKPRLYRVKFSDGQEIVADHDHQWLVSDFHGRNSARKDKHVAAITNWDAQQHVIDDLLALAARSSGDMSLDELTAYVLEHVPNIGWASKASAMESLDMVECPYRLETRTVKREFASEAFTKTDPVVVFDLDDTLHALYHRWTNVTGSNAKRWARQIASRAGAVEAVLANGVEPGAQETMPEIVRMLVEAGAEFPGTPAQCASELRKYVRSVGIVSSQAMREVTVPVTGDYTMRAEVRVYDAQVAVKALAQRHAERFHTRPRTGALEHRMTTGEMLASGLRLSQGHSNFAVPVTAALDLPDADLPVDPYVFGAWLGDGSTSVALIAADPAKKGEPESDMTHMRRQIEDAGYAVTDPTPSAPYSLRIRGRDSYFRQTGAFNNKHIPMTYLRASAAQRLAVLQGLMDTDGTISTGGACELSLSDKRLATDALNLIRSLGIKASASWDQPAGYKDDDGNLVECKNRHRIKFTTDQPVFRLPRKAARIPDTLRETQGWLYITDIEPVTEDDPDYGPARCISVDNDDHTYLCGDGYVVTSNTQLALHLMYQYAKMGRPGIFIDPKALSLDTEIPTPGGYTTMGDIAVGDTVYDRHGRPCQVTHKSRVFTPDETHITEIVFDDGQVVKADQNHLWVTYTSEQARRYWDATTLFTPDELVERARLLLPDGADPIQADAPFGRVRLTGDLAVGMLVPFVDMHAPQDAPLFRSIQSIRTVAAEPAQCIRVDSPDHTYVVADGVVTHNTGSDHSPIVLAAGGQVASLDELTAADGIFDPIRFSATREVGVELAASMLMSVNPWGKAKDDMEVPLQHALNYGVQQGATCIGEALAAAKAGLPGLPPLLIERVEELAGSSPMFRACVGVKPGTTGLRVAEGITLIKVGNSHLDLPEPGQPPSSITQRIALALVRMMVFGSAMALTGRQGVVMLDEAWVFLGAGRHEVERLGRLARSQQVLPTLWTQRVSDAVDAGLSGYISRGLILAIEDRAEAEAACKLFKLEPTPERIARITAKATIGGTSHQGTAPNWNSMRALRDPKTGDVIRGSVAIYADLAGRAIPCEVVLPSDFLALSSTNPEDIRRRDEKIAAEAAARARAAEASAQDLGPDAGGAPLDNFFGG